MRLMICLLGLVCLALPSTAVAVDEFAGIDVRCPLFAYLTGRTPPTMVTYTPSELDPRNEANQRRLASSSIRADLEALRPAFDGLILYGYHEACTPRVVSIAADLKYRSVILAVWDPKSTDRKSVV